MIVESLGLILYKSTMAGDAAEADAPVAEVLDEGEAGIADMD